MERHKDLIGIRLTLSKDQNPPIEKVINLNIQPLTKGVYPSAIILAIEILGTLLLEPIWMANYC